MWRLFSFALSENRPPCRQRVLFIKQQTGTAARLFLYFIQLADNMELNRTTNWNCYLDFGNQTNFGQSIVYSFLIIIFCYIGKSTFQFFRRITHQKRHGYGF